MLSNWLLARNNLTGRPWRTLLLTGTIALASSLVVALSSAIRSAQSSVEYQLVQFLGGSDARIIHPSNGRIPVSILEEVRSWPEVADATGRLSGALTLLHADHRLDPDTRQPARLTPNAIGIEFDHEWGHRTITIADGRFPENRDEILIDPHTADLLHAATGDVLEVQRFGEPVTLIVCGRYERRKLGAMQRPRIFIDREILAEASSTEGLLTSISIVTHDDVDVDAFCLQHAEDLPEILNLEPSEMVSSGLARRVHASEITLLIASMMTFLGASFIIVTGLTTGVTERQRELALLRSIGAQRLQLAGGQLTTGLFLGICGAGIGLPFGLALTWILVQIYAEHLPAGLHVHEGGLVLSLCGALGAGLLGALYPAVLASRITPLQALSSRAIAPSRKGIGMACMLSAGLITLPFILMQLGDPEWRFWSYVWAGLPSLMIGCFILAIPALVLVTRTVANPLSHLLRIPRDMLRGCILSTPYRHGVTAGALMFGLTIFVEAWVNGIAIQRDWIDQIHVGDGFAYRGNGISEESQAAIESLPFISQFCRIGRIEVEVVDRQVFGITDLTTRNVICIGFEADQFFEMNTVEWIQGDLESAVPALQDGSGILVAEQFLTAKSLGLGDSLVLGVGRIERSFEIVGVITSAGLDMATQLFGIRNAYMDMAVSCVFVDRNTVADVFDNRDVHILQVNLDDAITDAEAEQRVNEAAPGVIFRSGRWITRTIDDVTKTSLAIQSTIALAAMILASLAVGNVIAANVQSRSYEYGVMRSIGTSRGVLVRMILGETALLGITSVLVGTTGGFLLAFFGRGHVRGLAGLDLGYTIPVLPIIMGWAILLALACLSALPAALQLIRSQPSALVADGRNA